MVWDQVVKGTLQLLKHSKLRNRSIFEITRKLAGNKLTDNLETRLSNVPVNPRAKKALKLCNVELSLVQIQVGSFISVSGGTWF